MALEALNARNRGSVGEKKNTKRGRNVHNDTKDCANCSMATFGKQILHII